MAANRLNSHLGRLLLAACITVTGLLASEHHGIVKSGGIPVPGATITATQGDKKIVTTTDDAGYYSFPELADGVWTITVDSLGFVKASKEVGVAADAPSPMWDLSYATLDAITAPVTAPTAPAAGTTAPAATAPATTAAATTPSEKAAETKPATPATPASTTPAASGKAPAKNAKNSKNSKATPATTATAGANGRPSLNAALAGRGQSGGFTRLGVQGSGGDQAAAEAAPPDMGDMSAAGNSSFTINGSVSSGLDMPQPGGDWFGGGRGGPGGMDMGGMGMGPGGVPGMGPGGGDATLNTLGADTGGAAAGGRGGRGGGGPGGGAGGPGGGGGGRGGGGGGMMAGIPMMPGGGGGRGGRGGGRGGPGGPGGRNPASFGNNRRNPRSRYNFSVSGNLTQSALNAQQESISGISVKKPDSYNLGTTFTAGGPLKIPKLGGTDKGTFTLTYTLGRRRIGTTGSNLLVPTDAERMGDFSGYVGANNVPIQLYDPTGHPYTNNIIPSGSINPIATALLKYYPEPNIFNNPLYNYTASTTQHSSSDNVNLRLNYTFNAKNQANGSLQWQRSDTISPNYFGFIDNGTNNGINGSASLIHHFTSRLIATTRYNYSKSTALSTPFFANLTNVEGSLGILGTEQSPQNWGPPSLSFTGASFLNLQDGIQAYNHPQTSAAGESLLWVHTTHEFTFGGDVSRRETNILSQTNPRGSYNFNGSATGILVNGQPQAGTGLDLADFLVGTPTTSKIAFGNADKYFRSSVYDIYANDQWRISTRISLQLGLRWDYQVPTVEKYDRIANLDISPDFSKAQAVLPGAVGPNTGITYGNGLVRTQRSDISPRIGFAWKPFAKRSTVVRGGWGIAYQPSIYQNLASNSATSLGAQAPFAKSFSLGNSATCPLTLQGGFSSQTLALCNASNQATNTFAVDPNLHIPYSQQWLVSVQQNLKWSLVSTLSYIGAKSEHLPQTFYPNTAPDTNVAQYPYLNNPGGYLYETTSGYSSYNSLQAQLQRRSRAGFGGNVSFSYSKGTDDTGLAQVWYDPWAERARSAIPLESLNSTLTYSTGVGARGGGLINGWKGVLVKDWTINESVNITSGIPFTPSTGLQAHSLTTAGAVPIRPDLTGAPLYINGLPSAAAFAQPSGNWGDMGRNTLTGPYTFTMNASATRTFRLGDRKSATFSLRASNPLNHFVVTSWNTLVSPTNALFGQPQAFSAARQVTANVRISF